MIGCVNASSVAVWQTPGIINKLNYLYEDIISLSLPSSFLLSYSNLTETNVFKLKTGYKTKESGSSVAYAFKEYIDIGDMFSFNNTNLIGHSVRQSGSPQNIKIVSSYVHTYGMFSPSISIGFSPTALSGGVSIGINGTAWELASSVIIYA